MISRVVIEHAIEQNLTDRNFCVERLAELLNISTSYLRKVVHHHFRITPHALIRKLRLQRAQQLFSPNQTIKSIGYRVGYFNQRTFRNACRREFGDLPTKVFNGKKNPIRLRMASAEKMDGKM